MISNNTRLELMGAVQQLHDYVAGIEQQAQTPRLDNCLNCLFFTEKTEQCGKYKMRPPARTIVEGCPSWDLDIPF